MATVAVPATQIKESGPATASTSPRVGMRESNAAPHHALPYKPQPQRLPLNTDALRATATKPHKRMVVFEILRAAAHNSRLDTPGSSAAAAAEAAFFGTCRHALEEGEICTLCG